MFVRLLLNLLSKKWWYAELMTFFIALSMGTMYCITIFQFIPESLGESPRFLFYWLLFSEFHVEHILSFNSPCSMKDTLSNLPTLVTSNCTEKCAEGAILPRAIWYRGGLGDSAFSFIKGTRWNCTRKWW